VRARFPDVVEKGRVLRPGLATPRGETCGAFYLKAPTGAVLFVMVGDAVEWPFPGPPFEHVSAHVRPDRATDPRRCPTWEEMCWLKDLFFGPEEVVVQYHPPKSAAVNIHNWTLHLWRPVGVEVPLPPAACV
jgi:hypothetical protein